MFILKTKLLDILTFTCHYTNDEIKFINRHCDLSVVGAQKLSIYFKVLVMLLIYSIVY